MPAYLKISEEIAREAGALLHGYFERHIGFELKGEYDLVTEADRASEKLIIERLHQQFPTHSIVAEESGGHAGESVEYCWYVDPLDGTTNFAHGFPVYNVTLALEQAGEIVAGVIFDPERGEMFSCEKGSGAYLNGRPIHVSRVDAIDDALVATGFPSRKRHQDINVHFYYQLAMITHGVRRAGAAALDLAYVASGRLDAYWEFALNPWDMAAGSLLVTEAGGKCSDMDGRPARVRGPHLLVDNGAIHQGMLEAFGEVFRHQYRYPMP
ncbi:MAG: inositol monophosphatase, partial [Bryobacterales bacterium]|nr:inositol monophosphatase [Bryobacterales bacterium]